MTKINDLLIATFDYIPSCYCYGLNYSFFNDLSRVLSIICPPLLSTDYYKSCTAVSKGSGKIMAGRVIYAEFRAVTDRQTDKRAETLGRRVAE